MHGFFNNTANSPPPYRTNIKQMHSIGTFFYSLNEITRSFGFAESAFARHKIK